MGLFKKKLEEPQRTQVMFKEKYPNYELGAFTYGIPEVYDWREGTTLKIGAYCSISSNVKIYLGGHHRTDWVSSYPFPAFFQSAKEIEGFGGTNGDVIIGSDVWICANVTILSGVNIGHGAVIANGSIVTKDVQPYEIVGGNPAKHIRFRFKEETRERLLANPWWQLQEEEINKITKYLASPDVEALLEYMENRK